MVEKSGSDKLLATYLGELKHYKLIKRDEEQELARKFRDGDAHAGHKLVTSNLRFVVKVAFEYQSYGLKMSDLIQEGNIGLMKAVQKFDPDRGIHLISYAVWWIRAYIQNYILHSWSLVKLGTTQAQRKLFFSLSRTRRELERFGAEEAPGDHVEEIARRLNVKTTEVVEMQQRMGGHDLSLDAPMGDDGNESHVDFLASMNTGQEDQVADMQEARMVSGRVQRALQGLDPRERYIIEKRVLSDGSVTLRELAAHFGFSRERARQLELRALEKLKTLLADVSVELSYGTVPGALAPARAGLGV